MKKNLFGILLTLFGLILVVISILLIVMSFADINYSFPLQNILIELLFSIGIILVPILFFAGIVLLTFGKIITLLADIEYNTRKEKIKSKRDLPQVLKK